VPLASKVFSEAGGKFLARPGIATAVDGTAPDQVALIAFDSLGRIQRRQKTGDKYAKFRIFAVEGLAPWPQIYIRLRGAAYDQNHTEAFHHHGTSGGWPKSSSGPRKGFCLMADQAQKIALHTTSALPPTTKTSPRITIAVSYFSRPSFLLRWGLLYPVAIPPASWSSPQRHRP
jgi:hypothetical protein